MPAYVPKAERAARRKRAKTAKTETEIRPHFEAAHAFERAYEAFDAQQRSETTDGDHQESVVGRLRHYLNASSGRNFDPTDPTTTEGHLLDPNSACWFVPNDADIQQQRQRRKSSRGQKVSDINAGDVGRFKMSDFTVRSKDDRGHGTSLRIAMPDQMADELAAIVNSRVFPSRDVEKLALAFIYEGILFIRALAKQDGLTIPHSHFAHLEAIAVGHRHVLAVLQYDDMLHDYSNGVKDLLGRGARNKARAAALDMLEIVKKLDSSELRERWEWKIKSDFAHILRGKGAQVHVARESSSSTTRTETEDAYAG